MDGNKNFFKFVALFCATGLISFLMTICAKMTGDCLDYFINGPFFSELLRGGLYVVSLVIGTRLIICYGEWIEKKEGADFDQTGFDRYVCKIFCLLILILIIDFLILMYMISFLDKFKMIIPERWIEAISNVARF